MSEVKCEVIRDLLPLYADGLASEESAKLCREHIADCETCMTYYEELKGAMRIETSAEADGEALKKVRDRLHRNKLNWVLLCASAALLILTIVFTVLTKPTYLSWEDGLAEVVEVSECELRVDFREPVTGFEKTEYTDEDGTYCVLLNAWSTKWDKLLGAAAPSTVLVLPDTGTRVYYSRADEEAVLIYSSGEETVSGGLLEMSRLVIGAYFILALVTFAILGILHIVLHRRHAGNVLGALATAPAVWITVCSLYMGTDMTSCDAGRDFVIITFMAILIWVAVLSLVGLIKER